MSSLGRRDCRAAKDNDEASGNHIRFVALAWGLAAWAGQWHGAAMANEPKNPMAGGIFIALGAALGVAVGHWFGGQTTIGLLSGLGVGGAIALTIWWFGRR
jgi:hypothetical protein